MSPYKNGHIWKIKKNIITFDKKINDMSKRKKIATPAVIEEFAKKHDFFVISESLIDKDGKTVKIHRLIQNYSPDRKGLSSSIFIISIPNGQVMKWESYGFYVPKLGDKRIKAKTINEITTKLTKYV